MLSFELTVKQLEKIRRLTSGVLEEVAFVLVVVMF